MKRPVLTLVGLAALMALTACSEKPQTSAGTRRDVAAFEGVTNSFAAPGWKAGDKKAWEQQLKTRAQNGQNEYNRVN
jgi:hypothetical protein